MTTKTKAAAKPKTPVSHAKTPAPTTTDNSKPIAVKLIDTHDQVRSTMDPDTIKELASNIATHGVLQNLIVTQAKGGRFNLVAGHRRLAAAKLLGLESVPARIITVKRPELVQLAENIHREELTLEDQAKAIRKLYDAVENVQEVADLCHKSKPWISKRLAMTYPDFGYRAHQLIVDGITADLEIIKAMSDVETLDHKTAMEMDAAIRAGKVDRKIARQWLAECKKRMTENEKKERDRIQRREQKKAEEAAKPEAFNLHWAIADLGRDIMNPEPTHTVENLLTRFQPKQLADIEHELTTCYKQGQEQARSNGRDAYRVMVRRELLTERDDELHEAAYLAGFFLQPWTGLPAFLTQLRSNLIDPAPEATPEKGKK